MKARYVVALSVLTGITSIGITAAAHAADMTRDELKAYIAGKMIYMRSTAPSSTGKAGQSMIYFAADGVVLNKMPIGVIWHGKWVTKDNTLCVDWKERPNNPCVTFAKNGDVVTVHTAQSGELRATVMKNAAGNAENIKP
jgi:hypothetical protein